MSDVTRFVGSIPELYERHLGPALFEPYARDLAGRVPKGTRRVLEIAAGTGRVTRRLLDVLGDDGELVATDLNEPMLAEAQRRTEDGRVRWQVADAQALPFDAGSFDVVVCQFGIMFMPDKALALREMRRVLRAGGTALVNTWNDLDHNPSTKLLHELAFETFPDNPPLFMLTPFSMHEPGALHALVAAAGFSDVRIETVSKTCEAESARHLAVGLVRGNPLWNQLVERNVDAPAFEATVADRLARAFGDGPCRSALSAHVVTALA